MSVYETLLRLYPPAFRREFASDMAQDFDDASREAWANDGWRGLLSLWLFTSADLVRSVPIQWLRSGALIVGALALASATGCAAAVAILAPRVTYRMRFIGVQGDELLLVIVATTLVVLIATTIIFSWLFVRPALNRRARVRRV
jgi:hypothetical protein